MGGDFMNKIGSSLYFLAGVCLLWQASATASVRLNTNALPLGRMGNDFVLDQKQFKGDWQDGKQWQGTLCDGEYQYKVNLNGETNKLDFEIADETSLIAFADLRQVYAGLNGFYKSSYTACLPMGGWLGVLADSVYIRVKVTLGGEDPTDVKVSVLETKFGTIHMGDFVPTWFEEFATDLVNRALVKIWPSRLGQWLSGKLGEILKDKIPNP